MEYLEERYPHQSLLPKQIEQRALVRFSFKAQNMDLTIYIIFICTLRQICELIASGIQPLQNLSTLYKIKNTNEDEKLEWAQYWINKGLHGLQYMFDKVNKNQILAFIS
jgi:maleylacetoacetate isomerase